MKLCLLCVYFNKKKHVLPSTSNISFKVIKKSKKIVLVHYNILYVSIYILYFFATLFTLAGIKEKITILCHKNQGGLEKRTLKVVIIPPKQSSFDNLCGTLVIFNSLRCSFV